LTTGERLIILYLFSFFWKVYLFLLTSGFFFF
jgi:hypothetical protein